MKLLAVLCLTLSMTSAGCASLGPSYSITIQNSTGVRIDDAHVSWDSFKSVGGSFNPGVHKAHRFITVPLPLRVAVRWRTQDGVDHWQEVDVPKDLPRPFKGTLRFELLEEGRVELRVEH
jgi:hypothetical protein